MEQLSNMITQKLKIMAEAEDCQPLQIKCKAITTLFSYAVLQERDGKSEMLHTILQAARASKTPGNQNFMWHHVTQFVSTLFSEASPHAAILASPHIPWILLRDRGDLVQWWAATVSEVPHSEDVVRSVVDTLLQIAYWDELLPYIPVDLWSWLSKQPSLPPFCTGRYYGTVGSIVEAVRAFKDIEVLKSYFLLTWSEWDCLKSGFNEMCTSISEDFGGSGMGHHRADLIQQLDHVLSQLDCGSEIFKQHNPLFHEDHLQIRKDQYQKLREILLEMNLKAIGGMPYLMILPLCMLTHTLDIYRIPYSIYVCIPSLMSLVS